MDHRRRIVKWCANERRANLYRGHGTSFHLDNPNNPWGSFTYCGVGTDCVNSAVRGVVDASISLFQTEVQEQEQIAKDKSRQSVINFEALTINLKKAEGRRFGRRKAFYDVRFETLQECERQLY